MMPTFNLEAVKLGIEFADKLIDMTPEIAERALLAATTSWLSCFGPNAGDAALHLHLWIMKALAKGDKELSRRPIHRPNVAVGIIDVLAELPRNVGAEVLPLIISGCLPMYSDDLEEALDLLCAKVRSNPCHPRSTFHA